MSSIQSRIFRVGLRISGVLFYNPRCPVKYQRYAASKIAPRLLMAPKGVVFEPLVVEGIPAAWLVPEGADSDQVILYLHGGAYVVGSIRSYWKLAARIAGAAGCRALVVEYRLAPENQYPAAIEDAVNAYHWLLRQGYQPDRIVIAGDSAGGALAAATLVSLRDSGDPLPAAAIMLSPWVNLEATGETIKTNARTDWISEKWLKWSANLYLGKADPKGPLASPLYADHKGLPPMLIHTGTSEILLDDARRLAERAREDGVEVELEVFEGMFHVWHLCCPLVPESEDAVKKLGSYCRDKMRSGQA